MAEKTKTLPAATVYIPTLNGGPSLEKCLHSLEAQTVPIEVVVADNGSGDGCRELMEAQFPWYTRIAFGKNLGFGAALNRAIAAHGSGPIVLINDDAEASPDFVENLLSKWAGGITQMVAGVMLGADGTIDSAGVQADTTLLGWDYLNGRPVAELDSAPDPFGPTGGGCLYDRDAFNAVGGFDENIFLYYEDLDLALRIRDAGGSCRLAPDARARHGYSETLGAGSPAKYGYTGWSRGYLLGRYRILRSPLALLNVLVVEGLVSAVQLATSRSAAGSKGRVAGWRTGRGLAARKARSTALLPASVSRSLKLKLARRRS